MKAHKLHMLYQFSTDRMSQPVFLTVFLPFQGTYLAGNECVPCKYCHQGEMVAKECTEASDTVCQKADLPQPTKLCKCPSKKPKTTQTPPNKTKPMTDTKRGNYHFYYFTKRLSSY